jgi:hypothetical protein
VEDDLEDIAGAVVDFGLDDAGLADLDVVGLAPIGLGVVDLGRLVVDLLVVCFLLRCSQALSKNVAGDDAFGRTKLSTHAE